MIQRCMMEIPYLNYLQKTMRLPYSTSAPTTWRQESCQTLHDRNPMPGDNHNSHCTANWKWSRILCPDNCSGAAQLELMLTRTDRRNCTHCPHSPELISRKCAPGATLSPPKERWESTLKYNTWSSRREDWAAKGDWWYKYLLHGTLHRTKILSYRIQEAILQIRPSVQWLSGVISDSAYRHVHKV